MEMLFGGSTIKQFGAGIDDDVLARRISLLVGQHEVRLVLIEPGWVLGLLEASLDPLPGSGDRYVCSDLRARRDVLCRVRAVEPV